MAWNRRRAYDKSSGCPHLAGRAVYDLPAPAHKARGMLWEFVGGKVEPGESKEQALVRECREELAVEVAVGDIFLEVTHTYPDITVHLTLFHAPLSKGCPRSWSTTISATLRWMRFLNMSSARRMK